MNLKTVTLYIGLLILMVGCASHTPGDAAYRGGHFEQAANLYYQGAELGDKSAALKLGLMISENEISTTNYGNAVEWFTKACELGSDAGCHNSGNVYEKALMGANKDYDKARKYYSIAAEKGFIQSQYNLGTLYSMQYFNDDVEGLKWILIAKKTADTCSDVPLCQWVIKDPPAHQNKLMNRMTEDQIAAAQKQADAWTVKQ